MASAITVFFNSHTVISQPIEKGTPILNLSKQAQKKWLEIESKEKNMSRIRKKTFYLQFCMGTPQGQRTPEVKKQRYK
jgi:hypothetical protein